MDQQAQNPAQRTAEVWAKARRYADRCAARLDRIEAKRNRAYIHLFRFGRFLAHRERLALEIRCDRLDILYRAAFQAAEFAERMAERAAAHRAEAEA